MIALGSWEPDRSPRLNDTVLSVASGAYPSADGWRPCGALENVQDPIGATAKGGATFTSPQGVSSQIVGTNTNLYRASGSGWESIGSGYNLQGDGRWRFAQFGGLAIATNGVDPVQKIDLSTFAVADLGGNPPKFTILAVVKDFLVGGVRDGEVNTIGWSGLNNAEFWTVAQRQSDYSILASGGEVTGILGGEYGVILQRNRITRLDYVGGNTIFQINETSSNIGCLTRHSVAQWGNLGFFLSDAGFMKDEGQPVPIGEERVNRWFFDRYGPEDWNAMSTAIDSVNKCVMWAMPDLVIAYNWVLDRFFTLPVAAEIVFSGVTRSILLDEQDPDYGVVDDDLDGAALPSFDDPKFKGGFPRLYILTSDGMGALTGAPMAATFTGADIELVKGRRANLRLARPDIDATGGVSLTLEGKQRLGDAYDTSTASAMVSSGDMPCRHSARYTRPVWLVNAGTAWSYFKGAEYIGAAGAGR